MAGVATTPYSLRLPPVLAAWKVRIFDNELVETPHATVVKGTHKWRINLRTGNFMDSRPSPRGVDKRVLVTIKERLPALREAWNRMFPNNPV
jgi:hypothetical protein